MSSKTGKPPPKTIALNKRAKRDYHIEQTFEAGLVLEGWEVKSLRAGKAQLVDSYVLVRDGLEALILRPVFYRLVEFAEEAEDGSGRLGVWSGGTYFILGNAT